MQIKPFSKPFLPIFLMLRQNNRSKIIVLPIAGIKNI
jgi:hypothetical protein